MHLFVYGTLRRGAAHPMHRWLESAEYLGTGRFRGRLYDVGSYPAAVASDDPADAVLGEVYRLREPAAILAELDRYEGCTPTDPAPHEYRRAAADIRLEAGPTVSAQIYLYQWRIGDLGWRARQPSRPVDDPGKPTPPADSTATSC